MALTSVATAALMPPRRSVSPPEKEGEMGGEGEKLTPQTNSCPCKAGEGILQQLIPHSTPMKLNELQVRSSNTLIRE